MLFRSVFLFLKASGRRGIRQLSLFELVIILTLGSAAGDVTLYEDVPILPVIMVFLVLLLTYRATTYLLCRSPGFAAWIEGTPVTLIRDGLYEIPSLEHLNISEEEFFMELRQEGVEHLGQVRLAIVEVDGEVSVYFFDNSEIRPGLSVLPEAHRSSYTTVPTLATYACNRCGYVREIPALQTARCPRCSGSIWSRALNTARSH